MKYKTLFRVLLKFLGVWIFFGGVEGAVQGAMQVMAYSLDQSSFGGGLPLWAWISGLSQVIPLAVGLYLFFGGDWIVNKAIPSNRPYCADCGYDLSKNTADRCQECGAATPPPDGS